MALREFYLMMERYELFAHDSTTAAAKTKLGFEVDIVKG